MLQKTQGALNYRQSGGCAGVNAATISHLKRQVYRMGVKRAQLMGRPTLTRVDYSDLEEISATISRYNQRIADLVRDDNCEVEDDTLGKEYDL